MIFLCGVHGVGKSYFCEQIKRKIDIETYTASELISAEKKNSSHLINIIKILMIIRNIF